MNRIIWLTFFLLCSSLSLSYAQHYSQWYEVGEFLAKENFLQIPVRNSAVEKRLYIFEGDNLLRWFDVNLADTNENPDWYAYVELDEWKNKKLSLRVKKGQDVPSEFKFIQTSLDTNRVELYKEKYRSQLHFSVNRGWNNDPNGLVYYNGEYHMFFQNNPFGIKAGNQSWGHATSKDLVHWTQHKVALFPDSTGFMFSGSGVVDIDNTSGLGKDGKSPMLMFYTAAADTWTQRAAYSLDGRNFTKLSFPVVKKIVDANRDPKVFWYEPGQHWVMVLLVPEKTQNVMYFFVSKDLLNWQQTSKTYGGIGGDRYLHECPEFFELPVQGSQDEKKWIIWGGNGEYALGTFDGKAFYPEAERLSYQYGRGYYAAQTFNNEPQKRRIEVGWWQPKTDTDSMYFNQGISLPAEIKLVKTPKGLRLQRKPIEELSILRQDSVKFRECKINSFSSNVLKDASSELSEIKVIVEPQDNVSAVVFVFRGITFRYNVLEQELVFEDIGLRVPIPLRDGKFDLHCFVDNTGMEFFADNGLIYIPLPYNYLPKKLSSDDITYKLYVDKGSAILHQLDFYRLKSIWK